MDKRYFSVDRDFIKTYNEEIDEGYLHEVDVQYIEKLHELHNHLLFLPERMKTKKFKKLVANLQFKTSIKSWIRFEKKVIKVIKFIQNTWLKT